MFKVCVELYQYYQPSTACALIAREGQPVRFLNKYFTVTQRVKIYTIKATSLAMDVVSHAAETQNLEIHSRISRTAGI